LRIFWFENFADTDSILSIASGAPIGIDSDTDINDPEYDIIYYFDHTLYLDLLFSTKMVPIKNTKPVW
jgi:hypothetical protein